MNQTSDYLCYKTAFTIANDLIENKNRLGLYIMFGINTGLRYSDLKKLHDEDITEAKKHNNHLIVIEQKTKKRREIFLHKHVLESYEKFPKEGFLFLSQKGTVHTAQNLNQRLKKIFKESEIKNVSTHSLRKTFSRFFYDMAADKEDALVKLSHLLNHKDTAVTRRYLGLTREEMSDIYKGFENYIESFI